MFIGGTIKKIVFCGGCHFSCSLSLFWPCKPNGPQWAVFQNRSFFKNRSFSKIGRFQKICRFSKNCRFQKAVVFQQSVVFKNRPFSKIGRFSTIWRFFFKNRSFSKICCFQHIKKRSNQVPKKFFKKTEWVVSDMNVAPNYVFDSVKEIVKSQHTSIQGLILTIKMSDWKLAAEIPEYFALLKKWKFNFVRARQMQYHGQEFCLIAFKIRH